MVQIFLTYVLVINLFTLVVSIMDKGFAVYRRQRVPEGLMLAMSFFGGAAGALLARSLTGHKRLKADYCASLTLIVLLQAGVAVAIWSETARTETFAFYERLAAHFEQDEVSEADDPTNISGEPAMPRRFGPGS